MDDFDLEIKREFIGEALMNLEEAEGSFMELEHSADPKPLLDKIFRLAHNLKGGARAVGFGDVAEFTHQLENLVQKIQRAEVPLTGQVVNTLLRSNDLLVEMLSTLKTNFEARFENSVLIAEIQKWLLGGGASERVVTPVAQPSPEPPEAAPTTPLASEFFAGDAPAFTAAVPVAKPQESRANEDEVIRVNLSRIDKLNDFVGELIVLQSVVQQQCHLGQAVQVHVSLRQLAKLSKDIQSVSMGLRMLPVKPLIQKLQRVVRDTAQALDKNVELEVLGDQMEIDKSVLDRLADPLIHILRNAVDHGLEQPQERLQAGKSEIGKVTLSFVNEGNHLVIEARDDGKGINRDVLRQKAIEKRVIAESQPLTDKQLIHLIFHPGFSTKAEASEISGRGVGMDVVKTNVEKIGGQVDVSTVLGQGSVFRLQIPLSLAVIEGLVVTSVSGRYVVPLSQVQETININAHKIFTDKLGIGSCFELRGAVVPLFSVDEVLNSRQRPGPLNGTVLIVMVEDRPLGLVVEEILRAQQIVVKPLTNGISAQKGWIGSCVLGDGKPTLILSPVDLLRGKVTYGLSQEPGVAA